MKKQIIFFDLDGTIIDSSEGIYASIDFVISQMGLKRLNEEQKSTFIGPPLSDGFKRYYELTEKELASAIQYYRSFYQTEGIHQLKLYQGMHHLLSSLKQTHQLYIATSKPEESAKIILENLQLIKYFERVFGATLDHTRASKEAVLNYAINESELRDLESAVMIGDREHDIIGARKNGLEAIGVLYGFGNREELENAGAAAIVTRPEELLQLIK